MNSIFRRIFRTALLLLLPLLILGVFSPGIRAQETDLEPGDSLLTDSEDPGFDEQPEQKKPIFEGRIDLNLIARGINNKARFNPDNEIMELNGTRQTVETLLSLSDYPDEERVWRWLLKVHGYRLFESESISTEDKDETRIDELFVDWSSENWFASLGKRRNSWGPALAFNPVNVVVPPRDPLRPDQQTEGQPLFLVNFSSDSIALDLLLTRDYDREWFGRYARWGGRFALILEGMDVAVYYFDGESDENDVAYNTMTGFSYSGNFLNDSVLYLELATFSRNTRNYYTESGSVVTRDENVGKGVIGSNTTLDGNTSLLVEVYHNTAGYSAEEREAYFNTVDSVVLPVPDYTRFGILDDFQFSEMNRNYLLVSYRQSDILDKLTLVIQLLGAEDGSSVSELECDYNLSDFYKLSVNTKYYGGDENSEFGNYYVKSELTIGISASI